MLRRAAILLSRRPAASRRRVPSHQLTAAPSGRHPQVDLGGAAPITRLNVGDRARGYARMARRLPPAWPDGYSTSDGEADVPDAREREEDLELHAGAGGEEDEDAEGSELEGFMLDFGYGSGSDNEDGNVEEGGAEDREQ